MSPTPRLMGLPIDQTHPGAFLAEFVVPALKQDFGLTKPDVAAHLGMSRQALDNLLKAKAAVTPATALRLGKLVGNPAEFWMTMQANYDLRLARDKLGSQLDAVPTLTAA